MAKDGLLLGLMAVVLCTQLGLSNVVVDEIVDVVAAEAVAGFTALLPCDLSPPVPDDKVHLVIWYKDSIDLPIYSYDARGTAPEKGTHWAADSSLGERAYFRYKDEPSRLELRNIREGDVGLYRCRVDFRKSPTRNSKVNLTIILPPQKLSVLDERGAHIQHYILGPYSEGASMEIICLSTGGRPLPKVTWWQENALLDDSYETLSERRVRNVLRLERLERKHLHTVFTCQAANNNLVAPISSAVTLDLYLDPLWVRLLGQNRPMSADQSYEVSCEVVGARPAPIITWWKGNQPLRNARESVVGGDSNVTVSILKLTPTLDDAGEELTCRATTPPAERSVQQDSWILNIYHVPIVYLELIGRSNVSVIKEGVDITMECRIKSNPWVYRISWRHNGRTLFHNASAGTVFSNQTLSLLNITRARAGIYTCMGSNQEGDGESNAIVLDVKSPMKPFYEVLRVKRYANPDQKSKRRKKTRDAKEAEMEEFSRKKEELLQDLTLTMLSKRNHIARITKDQEKCQVWREERRKRLTASNFGMVCTTKGDKFGRQAVYDIMYNNVENACTRHGLSTQRRALQELREKHGVRGRRSGVFIDKELPYLAATPDGLVGDDAIIEVKCPLRAGEFKSAKLAARNGAVAYLSAANNGSVWLKRRSLYYYQVQGQLHITGRDKCHFFVYTGRWSHHEVILRDDQFWQERMVNKLKRFYLDCLLPEIVDPRYPARNNSKDIRDSDFITDALKKAEAKKKSFIISPAQKEQIIRQFENITLIMKKPQLSLACNRSKTTVARILTHPNVAVAPVCRPGQQRVVGAARQEATRVTCEVEANPATLHFSWKFNNSADAVDIPESQWTVDKTRSTVAYTPVHDWDFGSLLCWARNELGTQLEPCVYSVVPEAGRPDPLGNCTIVNQTAEMVEVECDPGYDGGLPQVFVMEVYDALDQTLVHNVSSRSSAFLVSGLPSGLELDLVLYSVNNKGRSRPSLLHAYTLRSAARRSVISPVMMHVTPILGVLAGVVVTLVCVIVAVVVVVKLRRTSHQDKKIQQKNATTSTHTSHSSDSVDSLEKNPDIIPQKDDFVESEELMFQKSKLNFYFSPDSESSTPAKPIFAKAVELTEVMPTAAYLERQQPRRVTFQCQAATLPRRMGAAPLPPPSVPGAADDSVLGVPATVIRLRPETSRLTTHF